MEEIKTEKRNIFQNAIKIVVELTISVGGIDYQKKDDMFIIKFQVKRVESSSREMYFSKGRGWNKITETSGRSQTAERDILYEKGMKSNSSET